MNVVPMGDRKRDPRVREQLQQYLALYDAGKLDGVALIGYGNNEICSCYVGDALPIVYGLEFLKQAILADD